ncbi:MAG TPA: creatininase family protein [Thermoplasmata archaeon]|nr:creatininase family protein [Thermoplasmata archaeon]
MRLDEWTSEEFAKRVTPDTVVILPVGSVEKHGSHLPLGSDLIQPLHVLEAVCAKTGAVLAPPIPYGVITTTRHYPGGIGISFDSLRAVTRDVLRDLVRNGVHRVMIVSGHAAHDHMAALRAAAQDVVDEGSLKATVLSDYDIIYAQKDLPAKEGHAGMIETSRLLVHRPDLVKGRSPAGSNRIPPYAVVKDAQPYWDGATGDSSKATEDYGKTLDRVVVDELVKLVQELRGRG